MCQWQSRPVFKIDYCINGFKMCIRDRFIPFDEDYYQAMAEVIEERFANWQGQDFDEDTLEPSEVAQAIMEYLDCECTYFPSMADDDPIMSAYSYAQRLGVREGFVPVLIKADDETLLELSLIHI